MIWSLFEINTYKLWTMYGYALISVDMLWANKPEGKLPYQILSVHIQEIQNIINETADG